MATIFARVRSRKLIEDIVAERQEAEAKRKAEEAKRMTLNKYIHTYRDDVVSGKRMNTFMDMCICNLIVRINNETNHDSSFYTVIRFFFQVLFPGRIHRGILRRRIYH